MAFSFRHVEIFWGVMTTGSATSAAALLHTSQPTVSRELARFEKLTGLTLFNRLNGKLVPTDEGLLLFNEVERSYLSLGRLVSAAEAIRNFSGGKLSITCLPAYSIALLPKVCAAYAVAFPEVSMSVCPQEPPLLQESMSSNQHHIGISEDDYAPPGASNELLLTADVVAVLPGGHRLCAKSILELHDFAGESFVYLAASDPYRMKLDDLFQYAGVHRRPVVETYSAVSACEMVVAGVGVAIINPITALGYVGQGAEIRSLVRSLPYSVHLMRPVLRREPRISDFFVATLKGFCDTIAQDLKTQLGVRG